MLKVLPKALATLALLPLTIPAVMLVAHHQHKTLTESAAAFDQQVNS